MGDNKGIGEVRGLTGYSYTRQIVWYSQMATTFFIVMIKHGSRSMVLVWYTIHYGTGDVNWLILSKIKQYTNEFV